MQEPTFQRNVGSYKSHTASHHRRRLTSKSPPLTPQILHGTRCCDLFCNVTVVIEHNVDISFSASYSGGPESDSRIKGRFSCPKVFLSFLDFYRQLLVEYIKEAMTTFFLAPSYSSSHGSNPEFIQLVTSLF
jgi:hypothetical protein